LKRKQKATGGEKILHRRDKMQKREKVKVRAKKLPKVSSHPLWWAREAGHQNTFLSKIRGAMPTY